MGKGKGKGKGKRRGREGKLGGAYESIFVGGGGKKMFVPPLGNIVPPPLRKLHKFKFT